MSVQAAAHGDEPKDHGLVAEHVRKSVTEGVIYEKRPVKSADGKPVAGLYHAWITLNNPAQFNSYTTEMVKSVILAFRAGERRPRRGRGGVYRRRRQSLPHRRQHQGIRRILCRQFAGIPWLYAAVQRHGLDHSRL